MTHGKTIAMALCVLACAGLLVVAGVQAGGFQDDPGVSTCLGPGDPFCPGQTGTSSGGGGGSTYCYTCSSTGGAPKCISGSSGDTCTVTYHPNGDVTCLADGGSCSGTTVSP